MNEKYKIVYENKGEKKELILDSDTFSNDNLPANIIEIKKLKINKKKTLTSKKIKLKSKDINSLFYELNLMLQSNLVISEALDILIKNRKDINIRKFLEKIKASFTSIESIEKQLQEFKVDDMILSFLSLCQKRGNIKLNINALTTLLLESYKIKDEFIKAIRYPFVLIVSFFISLNMIFYFVLPNFKTIFSDNISALPIATKVLFFTHYLYSNFFIFILFIFIALVFFAFYKYKNSEKFKYLCHELLVEKLFLIKEIYLNMQLYKLFLVIDIMLKSNYEFHQALSSSKVLLKNQYLLDKISLIENLLENGKTINYSFSQAKLFDDLILNLLSSAEASNSLAIISTEIKEIYKNRFTQKIKLLTSIIEPIFLVSLMGLILWIILAVFMPIWDMGKMINI